MRRPLGQSPRGDMGYVMPNVARHPLPTCHSEVSRAKRRTPRNFMRRSLAIARDDKKEGRHDKKESRGDKKDGSE
jgi:hypothetical protein